MADYGKKKNDELAALCKERSLPHTGKKADLVKRLEEYDTKNAEGAAPSKSATNEDEIDWDEEPATEQAKAATTEAAANAIAAGGVGEVSNPQAVPNQEAAIDPAKTNDLTVDPPAAEPAATDAPSEDKNFSSGIADRTIDEEIEKLRARCRRFGMDPDDNEQIKKLERAKKFGTTDLAVNSALKDDRDSKKRGREGTDLDAALQDDGLRDRKRSRGPRGRGKPGPGKRQGSERPKDGGANGSYPKWMNDRDREAAEKRKAKFSTT